MDCIPSNCICKNVTFHLKWYEGKKPIYSFVNFCLLKVWERFYDSIVCDTSLLVDVVESILSWTRASFMHRQVTCKMNNTICGMLPTLIALTISHLSNFHFFFQAIFNIPKQSLTCSTSAIKNDDILSFRLLTMRVKKGLSVHFHVWPSRFFFDLVFITRC